MSFSCLLFSFITLCIFAEAQERTINGVDLTFYAAGDNCPPGPAIAYPKGSACPTCKHTEAGGTGTYADPITYAGAKLATPPGTIIYINKYQKYFIMEDECEECDNDWNSNRKWHVDGWIGGPNIANGTTDCENALSVSSATIIVNATSGKTVNSTALFANGRCIVNTTHCVDQGNICGNTCQVPSTMTCQAAANLFLLTLTRFQQLNPKINCSNSITRGTTVCQAGSCGGP